MSSNADLRVQRTLALIRDAFMELVVARGFENVTVSAIAAQAQINRATFYRHYTDIYDLAERLTDLLFAGVTARFADSAASAGAESWQVLFEHVAEYAAFYRAMIAPGGIPGFRERVQETVAQQMAHTLPAFGYNPEQARLPPALAIRYMAAAQVGFVQWWLENEMPFSPETAALHLIALHQRGGIWALGMDPPA